MRTREAGRRRPRWCGPAGRRATAALAVTGLLGGCGDAQRPSAAAAPPAAPARTATAARALPAEVRHATLLVGTQKVDANDPETVRSSIELVRGDGRHRTVFPGGWAPRWSADGRFVGRLEQGGHANSYGGSSTKLVSSRLDGSARRLFRLPARGNRSPYSVESFSWIPGGRRLAVGAVVADGEEPPRTVFEAARDGSDLRRSLRSCPQPSAPNVAPDGRHVAYVCDGGVVVARSDGSRPRTLDLGRASELMLNPAGVLRWRPDGRVLAVGLWDESQSPQVRFVPGGGGRGTAPPHRAVASEDLTWSPDGRYIAYPLPTERDGGIAIARANDGRVITRIALAGASSVNWRP